MYRRALAKGEVDKTETFYPGWQYDAFIKSLHEILDNLYKGQGYEIAGFAWWQGHKDSGNQEWVDGYEKNPVNLIKDLRAEFKAPKAPFVIATVGSGGKGMGGNFLKIWEAQMAVGDPARYPDFAGNVLTMDTRDFWRSKEVSPSGQDYHYNRNAETYMLVGDALSRGMVKLLKGKK